MKTRAPSPELRDEALSVMAAVVAENEILGVVWDSCLHAAIEDLVGPITSACVRDGDTYSMHVVKLVPDPDGVHVSFELKF